MRESEKWKWTRSVVPDSLRPHGLQPTRLLCPWDFPGKSTGVGCQCYWLLNSVVSFQTILVALSADFNGISLFCLQCSPSHDSPYTFSLIAQLVKNLLAMQETLVRFLGQEDPLEKEMATHSSILAWRIPWTEEPGGLQSTGSQRIRHDWASNLTIYKLDN